MPLRVLTVQAPPVMIGGTETKVKLERFMRSEAPIYAARIEGIGYLEEEEVSTLAEMVETADAQRKTEPQSFQIGDFTLKPVATVNLANGSTKVTADSEGSPITITIGGNDSYALNRDNVESFGKAMGEIRSYFQAWQQAMGD